MKKRFLLFLFICLSSVFVHSQNTLDMNHTQLKTDTLSAERLSQLQPDSNIVSFKVSISTKGGLWEKTVRGNKLPADIVLNIQQLKPGSIVMYYEITGINKGVLVKLPARKYVIR